MNPFFLITPFTFHLSHISVAPLPKENDLLTKQELCSLPPVNPSPFSCLAFIPSWTYNATSGQCESYIYGGCGKTANLFQSEETCKATCETSKGIGLIVD